jgi:hypothetical protein
MTRLLCRAIYSKSEGTNGNDSEESISYVNYLKDRLVKGLVRYLDKGGEALAKARKSKIAAKKAIVKRRRAWKRENVNEKLQAAIAECIQEWSYHPAGGPPRNVGVQAFIKPRISHHLWECVWPMAKHHTATRVVMWTRLDTPDALPPVYYHAQFLTCRCDSPCARIKNIVTVKRGTWESFGNGSNPASVPSQMSK